MAKHKIIPKQSLLWVCIFVGVALIAVSCQTASRSRNASLEDGSITFKELIGEYYYGDGLGANCTLKLVKNGDFSFAWHGCLGLYATNYGGAKLTNGLLILAPRKPNQDFGTSIAFFPLRWGTRVYLVATNKLVDFCNCINDGSEPRVQCYGSHYLREKDWDKPVSGRPEIPVPWAEYLISKPIKGEIVYLVNNNEAWINIGSDNGLREGMTLTAWKSNPWTVISVRISVLEKDRCLIKHEWDDEKLDIGMIVGTRITQ